MSRPSRTTSTDPLRAVLAIGCLGIALSLATISVTAEASEGMIEQARAMLDAGRVSEAHSLAERAVRQRPRDPRAHLAFGSVLLREGRDGEAEKSFEFALALDPSMLSELASIYLAAAGQSAAVSELDRAEAFLARAIALDPQAEGLGAELLVGGALRSLREGEPDGRARLTRWITRFPDFAPSPEADLFDLASFHEAEGRLEEASTLYARCAEEYPDGELGGQASRLLETQRVRLDRLQSASCEGRLFVSLDDIEYRFATIRASFTLVWVSEDRYRRPSRSLRLHPETRLETRAGGVLSALGPAPVFDRAIELRSDWERRIMIEFPAAPRDQQLTRLVVENDSCGTTGNWRRRALHFSDLAGTDEAASTPGEREDGAIEIPVHHVHNYIIPGSLCSGTLRLTPESVSYLSGAHGFELPCSDVLRVYQSLPAASDPPSPQFGDARDGPLLAIEGRATGRRGKEKTKIWRFQDRNGMPPVLLLRKNFCR